MPTIVVKSIGTAGRNYSTVQAWDDACPVSLVAVDQVWKGECYNDTRLDGAVTLQGATTDVTRYMWLTTGPGQGNIYIRRNRLATVGACVEGHRHTFDHTTIVFTGAVHVRAVKPDGTV